MSNTALPLLPPPIPTLPAHLPATPRDSRIRTAAICSARRIIHAVIGRQLYIVVVGRPRRAAAGVDAAHIVRGACEVVDAEGKRDDLGYVSRGGGSEEGEDEGDESL